tara:strand:- start:392 stop:664 length:273 start_codon:yes stop_codon:yes gene_type:complete
MQIEFIGVSSDDSHGDMFRDEIDKLNEYKYSVWYGIDGCLPEQDYPLFESNNYRECKSFIANERREFIAEFGKPSRHNLYDWYIEEREYK